MGTRILTAIIALALVVPILVWGGVPGLTLLGSFAVGVCMVEYEGMSRVMRGPLSRGWHIAAALAIFLSIQTLNAPLILLVGALVVVGTFFLYLLKFDTIESVAAGWAYSVAGLFYAPFLLSFVVLLRAREFGLAWIALLMIVTWAGDSGAYFAGRAFGKHKLYPEVSPKKTWEGLFGGVVLSVVGAFVARATFFPQLSVVDCLLLAPVADLAGVAGDLCESLLKRASGVKDSGTILPGHGGMLDRLDSLFFSAPVVFGYAVFIFQRV